MKKYLLSLFIILFTIIASPVFAEIIDNSGFIPGQIWYSKSTLVEGDTVNIHTAVWNGEKESLTAKIEFYDKNVILGSRDIVVPPSELKDVYVPWKITQGDHAISAKIISSLKTVSGKEEKIVLENVVTSSDKRFVSVVIKNDQGEVVSGTDALKNQINKTSAEINSIIPKEVSTPISNVFSVADKFRDDIHTKVVIAKDETAKEIELIKNNVKTIEQSLDEKSNLEHAVKKPIAYVKLFFLSVFAFILANKIIFYLASVLVFYYIVRAIFHRV